METVTRTEHRQLTDFSSFKAATGGSKAIDHPAPHHPFLNSEAQQGERGQEHPRIPSSDFHICAQETRVIGGNYGLDFFLKELNAPSAAWSSFVSTEMCSPGLM